MNIRKIALLAQQCNDKNIQQYNNNNKKELYNIIIKSIHNQWFNSYTG